MIRITSIIITSFILSGCEGFLGLPPLVKAPESGNPNLPKYANAQDGIILNLQLDIPEDINNWRSSRLVVDGLRFELKNQAVSPCNGILGKKSNSGEIPSNVFEAIASSIEGDSDLDSTRSGPNHIDILSDGRFVSIQGQQNVEFTKACWEMSWKRDKLTGELICGLFLQEAARRNDAVLASGHVYLTFPIATKDSLELFQIKRDEYNNALNHYFRTQFEELEKMKKTKNPIAKLLHYGNCVDNYNSITKIKDEYDSNVPTIQSTSCTSLLEIGEGLVLWTKGKIWARKSAKEKDCHLVGVVNLK